MKLRIIAKEDNCRRYAVMFMGVKIAVAFSRDSGARVGYDAILVSGEIDSGGSRNNWYCIVYEGAVFELEIDEEIYKKNKNRIKKWEMIEIKEFSISKQKSEQFKHAADNLE